MRSALKLPLAIITSAVVSGAIVQAINAQAKPPAYLIFETEIKDSAAYEPHRQTSAREIQAQGGKYLVLGGQPEKLEGDAPRRVTISQWLSMDDIKKWHTSPSMKEANEARAKYTSTRLYAVEAKPN